MVAGNLGSTKLTTLSPSMGRAPTINIVPGEADYTLSSVDSRTTAAD